MRAAPQKRCHAHAPHLLAQRFGQDAIERDRIGRMRHAIGRPHRADAGCEQRVDQFRRKQRVGDDGVDRRGAGGAQRLGAGVKCRPRIRCRRPAAPADRQTAPDRQSRSRPSGRRGRSCARPRDRARAGRARSSTQGRDSSSGPTTTVAGSRPSRAASQRPPASAERSSASIPGNTRRYAGAMQMGIDRDDAVETLRQQPADRPSG